jgi:hypothetical protein
MPDVTASGVTAPVVVEPFAVLSGFIGETPFEEKITEVPCTLGRK